MRGVKEEELVSIIDFMYSGKAMIPKEDLDKFLALGKELDIKGLASDVEDTTVIEDIQSHIVEEVQTQISSDEGKGKKGEVVIMNTTPVVMDETNTVYIDNKVKTFLIRTEEKMPNGHFDFRCKVCGKNGYRAGIALHIESYHIDGIPLICNNCGKSFKSRVAKRNHICTGKKANHSLMDIIM